MPILPAQASLARTTGTFTKQSTQCVLLLKTVGALVRLVTATVTRLLAASR